MKDILFINRANKWFSYALFNLLIVSLAGLFLRTFLFSPFPGMNFQYFVHAHSHFAFAGWGFMALFIGLCYSFLSQETFLGKQYKGIFIAAELTAWGMLLSFPFKGYATVSIVFSTLYMLVTYWFAWRFFKDTSIEKKRPLSLKMAYAALFFMVLSTIGPYCMGPMMALGWEDKPIFNNAIYFYLHFQYNGWFIFGIAALFFRWMERRRIIFSQKNALTFYRILFWSCIPAYLLSILWAQPERIVFLVAGLAGAVQIYALVPLWRALKPCRRDLWQALTLTNKILGPVIASLFFIKPGMQFLSAFPPVVSWTVAVRPLVIGYLHLVLLGIITLFLLAFFIQEKILSINIVSVIGLTMFLAGFIITECILFTESVLAYFHAYMPDFNSWMFYFTLLFPAGLIFMVRGSPLAQNEVSSPIPTTAGFSPQ